MSKPDLDAEDITLPIKRTDGETLEERMSANAYHNILPARYLQKNADGDLTEDQEELFERVAKNIALAEAPFEAERQNVDVRVTPRQLKPDHPRRDELAQEVFGKGVTAGDDVQTALTAENVHKFAYDTIVRELPEEIAEVVEERAAEFQEQMENLSFTPNCVPPDSLVATEGGVRELRNVEPGERVHDDMDGSAHVESKFENGEKRVLEIQTNHGYRVRATPEHHFRVIDSTGQYVWRQVKDLSAGDYLALQRNFLDDDSETSTLQQLQPLTDGGTTVAEYTGGRPRNPIECPTKMTPRLAEWLGLYFGDGTTRKSSVRVAFDQKDSDLLHYWVRLTEQLFGFSPTSAPHGQADCLIGRANRRELYRFLEQNDLLKESSKNASIPPAVLKSGRTVIAAFLRGLMEADGTVGQRSIEFYSHSDDLIHQVQLLLLGLGIRSTRRPKGDGFRLRIRKNECGARFVKQVGFLSDRKQRQVERFESFGQNATTITIPHQSEALLEWYRESDLDHDAYRDLSQFLIDPSSEHSQEIGERIFEQYVAKYPELNESPIADHIRRDQVYDDVVEVRELGSMPVEDMQVPRRNTYVVEGFVSHNSPTIMNAGNELQQLSACFVLSPEDDLSDIHDKMSKAAAIFQSGGGCGYGFWKLRPYGDSVGSTGGIASGPITFMRTYDRMCETIAQGGTRRGAQMAIMRVSHPDVIEFIHAKNKDVSLAQCLKLNDPDDYTYTSFSEALEEARELIDEEGRVPKHLRNAVEGHLSNFNISVGVTDGFMEALQNDEEYTFTNPRTEEPHIATAETKEMYERYGLGEYVEVGEELSLPADVVWDRIVQGAHENGEPGVIYLERVNKEHSFDIEEHPDHRILATNPCLTGEMQVVLADGSTQAIGELAAQGTDVEVRTLVDDELTRSRATAFKTKENVPVVRLQTESGIELRATHDHQIRSHTGEWVEAGDLVPGDEVIGMSRPLASTHGTEHETTVETIASIEADGRASVYDLHVTDTHNFFASSEGGASVNVHNCGEQPLEEYEACNLGHINLSTLAATNAPDWRLWSKEHIDEHESLEDAIEAFLAEAIDWEEFDERIELATRFLENVVTMSDFPVDEITETVRAMRKIGLGIMGLAQLYIQLGVRYGSEPANEIARQVMTHINHGAKWTSHELAEERGVFADWDDSKYADPVRYREWFEHQTGLDADEWADGYPIRNHNVTTIAPTGTTGMVGNTTGGCEPIYNVAYYKNVSDDVQGDEMLVEFDDYFLRTLEANDIDVEAVKEEAQEQMANNAFDGIEGLDRVPNAIGELFVTTSDLSAKEHAAVQCACQEGVDSAISKTVNAPHHSTVEDAREVFEFIYEHGGKGVTYYRDGTRSKQVLTTRADNADFADEEEAAEAIIEQIEEVFGGIEAFTEHEAVQETATAELEALTTAAIDPESGYAKVRPRPDVLNGITQRIETGYGKVYVNINEDEHGRPFELFATIGNSGGFTNSFTEALAKTISTALRSGVDPYEIADELQGIRSPKVAWDKGQQINSVPDAIGTAMLRYLDGEVDPAYPQQQNLTELEEEQLQSPEADGGTQPVGAQGDATQRLLDAGESPECPDCGSMTLNFVEGCKTCGSCGWSEC